MICRFLLDDFHVYAVDTIGHPGKSAETDLSPRGYDYGKWANEVITELGYEKMLCFGGSFGGGILAKLMCYVPTFVIASEKDCLFPVKWVLPRAKRIIANCQTIELKGCGHMHVLPENVKKKIVDFLKQE